MEQKQVNYEPQEEIVDLTPVDGISNDLVVKVQELERKMLELEDLEDSDDTIVVGEDVLLSYYLDLYQEVQLYRKTIKAALVNKFIKEFNINPVELKVQFHYIVDFYLGKNDKEAIEYSALMSLQERMEQFLSSHVE